MRNYLPYRYLFPILKDPYLAKKYIPIVLLTKDCGTPYNTLAIFCSLFDSDQYKKNILDFKLTLSVECLILSTQKLKIYYIVLQVK